MVGAGKPGSAKAPIATAMLSSRPSDLPVNRSPAVRAEAKDDSIAFVADADIHLWLPPHFDCVASKACLSAKHAAAAPLAGKTMTDRNSDGVLGYGQ